MQCIGYCVDNVYIENCRYLRKLTVDYKGNCLLGYVCCNFAAKEKEKTS